MGAEPSAWRLGQLSANTDDERRRAALYVALKGRDLNERRDLLAALGLIPNTDTTTDTAREDTRA